jgi:hypothetical protein
MSCEAHSDPLTTDNIAVADIAVAGYAVAGVCELWDVKADIDTTWTDQTKVKSCGGCNE